VCCLFNFFRTPEPSHGPGRSVHVQTPCPLVKMQSLPMAARNGKKRLFCSTKNVIQPDTQVLLGSTLLSVWTVDCGVINTGTCLWSQSIIIGSTSDPDLMCNGPFIFLLQVITQLSPGPAQRHRDFGSRDYSNDSALPSQLVLPTT
jgi:hypothetical protein